MKTPANWKTVLEHALRNSNDSPEASYLQMATVKPDGTPAVRTAVFRSFVEDSEALVIHTDQRSDKVQQIEQQAKIQLCWYFRQSREQFRLSGCCSLVTGEVPQNSWQGELRQYQWEQLSAASKATYYGPPPGVPKKGTEQKVSHYTAFSQRHLANANFTLLLVSIDHVDYLNLTSSPHSRVIHELQNGRWHTQYVHP